VADNRGNDREEMSGGLLTFQKPEFRSTGDSKFLKMPGFKNRVAGEFLYEVFA
jgi:hypothetical protein